MRIAMIITILAVTFLMGCATTAGGKLSIPQQIPQAVHQACDTYNQVKPEIVKARTFAVANWDKIPPEAQQVLKQIDTYLPQLDKLGTDICAASAALNLLESNQNASTRSQLLKVIGGVDWNEALTLVMKAAGDYVTLKQSGIIH